MASFNYPIWSAKTMRIHQSHTKMQEIIGDITSTLVTEVLGLYSNKTKQILQQQQV
ncbi:hypothetical protein KDW_39540 [Dictyobacter vulcani]|uniref:Uncharacterized protein n=1 Tax=Dictyobacter vulcani TaxID=2607529 RepID=A0A5J4KRP8_9CHLR|nr:hypothetical protein KDW_39540 [Dictyobacter vulcani]